MRSLPVLLLLVPLLPPAGAAPAEAEVDLDMDAHVVEVRPDMPTQVWVTVTGRVRCDYGADPPPDLELHLSRPGDENVSHPSWAFAPHRFRLPWTSAGAQLTGPPLLASGGFHDWEVAQTVNATATAGPEAPALVLDNRWVLPTNSTDGPACTDEGMYYEAAWVDFQVVIVGAGGGEQGAQASSLLPPASGPPWGGIALLSALTCFVVFVLARARRRLN